MVSFGFFGSIECGLTQAELNLAVAANKERGGGKSRKRTEVTCKRGRRKEGKEGKIQNYNRMWPPVGTSVSSHNAATATTY